MNSIDKIDSVVHVIQLAIAPVFLLTAVGSLLAVLVGRLVRANDRYREMKRAGAQEQSATGAAERELEMANLARRAHLINTAITLCVVCALLVCVVIAILFVGFILNAGVATLISILFICSMLALILALLAFLREVFLASRNIPPHRPRRLKDSIINN
jgi:hypothetical protein